MMLRADELARIQAVNASWLNATCTITTPGTAQTPQGWQDIPEQLAADIPCRVEPASGGGGGRERQVGDGVVSAAQWNIVLPFDTLVTSACVITVDGVGVFTVVSASTGRGVQTDVVAACVKADA